MQRKLAAALAAVLVLLCLPRAAFAQSDSSAITIRVTDAATKQPLGVARVLLDGAVITSELTDAKGEVTFTDVPNGIYRARVVKRGYQTITSASFEVLDGRLVTVSVSLVEDTGGLKVIGTVAVKAAATISTSSIDQNSAQRRLSDDLAGALNKLSGVSVSTDSDDSDANQTISLEGHDASQTQLTLDGIPLNAPGSAGNLRGYATDLFQGASVHLGPSIGGQGGSVNFTTLQPTLSWISQLNLGTGSNARYNYSFAETGSVDKLGVAVQSVYRLQPSLVDGDYYLDASGLAYSHDGDSNISGNLVKARYEFSDSQAVTFTFLNSVRDTNIVCLRIDGSVPCGYGPNNTADGSLQLYSLTDNALIGDTQVQASLFSTTSTNLQDELNRYVNGEAQPIGYSGLDKSDGFSVNATLPSRERHTISILAYGTSSSQSTTPLVASANQYYNGSQSTSYSAIQATDTIHSSDKLSLSDSAGISAATDAGASLIATLGATWRPTRVDTYSASYSLGGVAASPGRSQILTDPASLRFDCNGNVAYGNAPGDSPGKSSSTSMRVGYTRTLRAGTVSLTLYRQVQDGTLLPVQVNGTSLVNELPLGYLQQVQALYDSPAGCNRPAGTPFELSQLYFSTPISGVQRVYEGGEFVSYVTLGNLVVQPYYNVTASRAISNSIYFSSPYAITISGDQLPNVPLQKAGITFDYKSPGSILEWLADAQFVARNNPNNLPSYATVDAGVTANLTYGTLTFVGSNLTDTYGGVFSTPANAVPLTTLGGVVLPQIARPLTPRSYSVTYSVKFGQGANLGTPARNIPSPPRGAGGRGGGFAGAGGDQGGQGSGSGRQGGGFGGLFKPLPDTPPTAPFDVTPDPTTCSVDNAKVAQQFSLELKAFVAKIEASKTASGYPATMASPSLTDAVITYHGLGQTYALSIVPKSTLHIRALAGCMTLHLARADDVTQRKLYVPASNLFFVQQLSFMPAVGLYIAPRQQQPGQESFRIYTLPSSPPSDPFQVRTAADTCTGDERNLATQALGELRGYFASGTATPSWTITAHTATGGTWYELDPADPSVIGALLVCGRVAASTTDELSKRGFDGKNVPELNYTKSLGIYLLRPTRPPGAGGNRQGGEEPPGGGPPGGGPPPGGPPPGGPP